MRAWPPAPANWAPPTSCARKSATPNPYADAAEFAGDLNVLAESLKLNHGAMLIVPRLAGLTRAAHIFGFHLASLDMRQTSDVHERVLAELFEKAKVEADYAALSEEDKVKLLLAEIAQPRLLYSPFEAYTDETQSELAIVRAAREIRQRYGARAIRNYIISHTEAVSDLLEVLLLLKEAGLVRPCSRRVGRDGDPAVRNHPRPAARRRDHGSLDGLGGR